MRAREVPPLLTRPMRFSLACRVYEGFSDLQEKIAALGLGSGFTENDRDMGVSSNCGRWNDVHHAVHAAG